MHRLYLRNREFNTELEEWTIEQLAPPPPPGPTNYEPYFFTTFAGPVGDRSIARFYFPEGAAVDGADNIYIADTGNNTIRKIAPDGTVITLAGCAYPTCADSAGNTNGQGTVARFRLPKGVAVDGSGDLFVADTYNHTIRKINPAERLVSSPE